MSKYFQEEPLFPEMRNAKGNCVDCNGPLVLLEEDYRRKTRVLVCERCGLMHLFAKNVLSKWKLIKVRKRESSFQ
jgi:DNA replicative helicase MCM subunit Mcm2 (Cdc46/Mcm family)